MRFPPPPWVRLVLALAGIALLFFTGLAQAAPDPKARPDDNRFTPVVLTQGTLDEPMVFEVLPDGRVYIAERKGGLKVYDPSIPGVKPMGHLAVNTRAKVGNSEQGLVGLTLDPKFAENGFLYLYYFHPTEAKGVVSRWQVKDDVLVANSEKVVLEWESQRETCCHTGGGTAWDADGNLLITIGNNRGNNISAHTDERPGRAAWDDQGGSANTASLEGKILRIHPEADGTYTIPKGNLFPPGTPKTRPEIFTMGHRNAWRVSIDRQTGYVYWGEVGPDGRKDTDIGPRGYDEFNQARGPGNFGWPYFVGESAFPWYDYAAKKPGATKDPARILNTSPNNTGLTELPPLAPAFIYYPYDASDKFPALGSGGRSATGGPIYRRAHFKEPRRPWPAYYEGKWLAAEFSRRAVFAISIRENGDFGGIERFLPGYKPVEPIDAKFGPEGDLYVLEYGGRWFQKSPDAKLVRIEYEAGNRKPTAVAATDRIGGVPPFEVKLSAAGTADPDRDPLTYHWEVFEAGGKPRVFDTPNPVVRFEGVGAAVAQLTVTDPSGASDRQSVSIVSGNEPPVVALKLISNGTFFFTNQPVAYSVEVADREDGTLSGGRIAPEKVALSIDYASAGFDVAALKGLPRGEEAAARFPVAQALLTRGNCRACHLVEGKLVGPSFTDVARKYAGDQDAMDRLTKKVVTGGAGAWGEVAMPPNALISESDAGTILKYVLSLAGDRGPSRPLAGTYTPELPRGDLGRGTVILRAVYTDQGEEGLPPLTAEGVRVLRSPALSPAQADVIQGVDVGGRGATASAGGRLGFNDLDLTGVGALELSANVIPPAGHLGGDIEVRLDTPDGPLVGKVPVVLPAARPASAPAEDADAPRPQRNVNRPPVVVPLAGVTGRHSLFLMFRNETAKAGDSLMSLASIRFVPAEPKP